jgi:ABC-type polysaccharide/polyol phosphate export permease
MKVEYNLSILEIVVRHILGMLLCIIGGFLGYYVSPVFFVITIFSPILILTSILGWCPLYSIMKINHAGH